MDINPNFILFGTVVMVIILLYLHLLCILKMLEYQVKALLPKSPEKEYPEKKKKKKVDYFAKWRWKYVCINDLLGRQLHYGYVVETNEEFIRLSDYIIEEKDRWSESVVRKQWQGETLLRWSVIKSISKIRVEEFTDKFPSLNYQEEKAETAEAVKLILL